MGKDGEVDPAELQDEGQTDVVSRASLNTHRLHHPE